MMQLGRTYFGARDYGAAATTFARVPRTDPAGREASFYAGLAYYYTGEFDKAENAFNYLSSLFPLTEVYNNLGVVAARRGKKSAAEYFEKAVEADEHDADYRFNFGAALARAGDTGGAARQLREALRLRPSDTEARILLDGVTRGDASARTRAPLERIKRNYDETSFRQLALEIQNATEARLANADPRTHAAYHVEHAHTLLEQKFMAEAGREFREAILLDPTNAAAHAGLAAVWEASNHLDGARTEADAALQLGQSAEAYLVLARLDWRANRRASAAEQLTKALALEPANPAALELQRTMAEKPQESP
jgi:Flp pilus assembly protein TadD